METNSPASTSGVKLPLDASDQRRVEIIQIPLHIEDIKNILESQEFEIPTTIDLVNVEFEVGPEVLTHGSATAAYACYQSHARMRQETFLSFPQWLALVMPLVKILHQAGQDLISLQTTA